MLAGFLTTALELIIILDVCGAIVYFALSGLLRAKEGSSGATSHPLQPAYPSPYSSCAAEGFASPSLPLDRLSDGPVPAIYAGSPPASEPARGFSLLAGFRHRISSLKNAFTYRPAGPGKPVAARVMDEEHRRLGHILDSFKEEI